VTPAQTESTERSTSESPRKIGQKQPILRAEIKSEDQDSVDDLAKLANRIDGINLVDEIAIQPYYESLIRRRALHPVGKEGGEYDDLGKVPKTTARPKYILPLRRKTKAVREAETVSAPDLKEKPAATKAGPIQRTLLDSDTVLLPVDEDWDDRIDDALHSRPPNRVLTSLSGGVDLTAGDMTRLRPGQWLNDEIVNAYLKLVITEGNARHNIKPGQAPKFHAFNSFFYGNLASKGYAGVSRWAKKAKLEGKNLLNAESILIPVNQNLHWTLLVITPAARQIEYFDSFSGNPNSHTKHVRRFLQGELGPLYKEDQWMTSQNGDENSPQQTNGYDCGVFAITTARMIVNGFDPKTYGQEDIEAQRRRIVAELLNGDLFPWGDGADEDDGWGVEEEEDDEDELGYG
jgi:hypothetical protein